MSGCKPTSAINRFLAKTIQQETGCVEWTGGRTRNGYGAFWSGVRMVTAHRWHFEQFHGELPSNIDCCHRCDNRLCVNVAHLFAGTRRENMADCVAKGRQKKGPCEKLQGEKHHQAKLKDGDIRFIRQAHVDGATLIRLAIRYRVSIPTIHRIVHRDTWSHVI